MKLGKSIQSFLTLLLILFLTNNSVLATTTLEGDSTTIEKELSFEDKSLIDLFTNYFNKKDYQWALSIWDEISAEAKENPKLEYQHMVAKNITIKPDSSYHRNEEFIKKYPNYGPALFWKAKVHFDRAEKRYQYEMDKYEKDKNTTAYAYLRRELRKLSSDYILARDILIKLKDIDPTNKNYLIYLRNSYVRLEMQEEAAQINKLIEDL